MSQRGDVHPELPVDPDVEHERDRPLHVQPVLLALVAAGGAAGAAARYAMSLAEPSRNGQFPWGTFAVNVVGALILGVLLEALARSGPDTGWRQRARLLIGTGFCGALTTYSTLAVETDLLVRSHAPGTALGYAAATVGSGVLATTAGIAAASGHHHWRTQRGPS